MPTEPGIYFDGDLTEATQNGPIVPRVDNINRATIWTQPMVWRSSLWKPLELDTPGPLGGILVEETQPQREIGDVVIWDRIFATVPEIHSEPTRLAHTFYQVSVLKTSFTSSVRPVTGIVLNEYFNVRNPADVPLKRATFFQVIDNTVVLFAGTSGPNDSVTVAEDSSVDRWMGNIWRMRTTYVGGLPPGLTKF